MAVAKALYYAVVSLGGSVAGARGVYRSREEAQEKINRAHADLHCGGRYWTDPAVVGRARINAYRTRKAAERADISDTAKQGLIIE